jgi:hypothetical protein
LVKAEGAKNACVVRGSHSSSRAPQESRGFRLAALRGAERPGSRAGSSGRLRRRSNSKTQDR